MRPSCSRRSGSTRARRSATSRTSSSCALDAWRTRRVSRRRPSIPRTAIRGRPWGWWKTSARRSSTGHCSTRYAALGISFYQAVRTNVPGDGFPGPRYAAFPRRPAARLAHRRAAHRRAARPDDPARRQAPGERRTARDAGTGDRALRPPLVQAQGRRRRAGRCRAPERDRRGAGPDRRALPRFARRQRAIRGRGTGARAPRRRWRPSRA